MDNCIKGLLERLGDAPVLLGIVDLKYKPNWKLQYVPDSKSFILFNIGSAQIFELYLDKKKTEQKKNKYVLHGKLQNSIRTKPLGLYLTIPFDSEPYAKAYGPDNMAICPIYFDILGDCKFLENVLLMKPPYLAPRDHPPPYSSSENDPIIMRDI